MNQQHPAVSKRRSKSTGKQDEDVIRAHMAEASCSRPQTLKSSSKCPSTLPRSPLASLQEKAICSLYRFSLLVSKKTNKAWKSHSLTADLVAPPLQILDIANQSCRAILLKYIDTIKSPALNSHLLESLIEITPKSASAFLPSLLSGDCRQRFQIASKLIDQLTRNHIYGQLHYCTPSACGINDPDLQRELYLRVFEAGYTLRDDHVLSQQDIATISTFDREFQVQAYAWILETFGCNGSSLAQVKLTQDEYAQSYQMLYRRIAEDKDLFYKSVLHQNKHLLPITDPAIRLNLFRSLYDIDSKSAVQCIDHFDLTDCEQYALSSIVESACKNGHWDILRSIAPSILSPDLQEYLITALGKEHPDFLYSDTLASWFPLSESLTRKLFHNAITTGRWDAAIEIGSLHAQRTTDRVTPAMQKKSCQSLLASHSHTDNHGNETILFEKLLKANLLPTTVMFEALSFYGHSHEDFLVGILSSCGQNKGSSVMRELSTICPTPESLTPRTKRCITAFLNTGFRGFSTTSFKVFQQHWEQNPQEARKHVANWKELSRSISENRVLSREQLRDPLFFDCVYDVYQPVGLSQSRILGILKKVRDNSKHLDGLIIKRDGYLVETHRHGVPRTFVGYITKAPHSFLGRAGAGLCTDVDYQSWNDPSWLQMNIFDPEKEYLVGNIQLNRFTDHNKNKAVLARFNPTSRILFEVDGYALAIGMLEATTAFAEANKLLVYTPENTDAHLLSNDIDFAGILKTFQGEDIPCNIRLATLYTSYTAYRTTLPR